MKNLSRKPTILMNKQLLQLHSCPSNCLFLVGNNGLKNAAEILGVTVSTVYYYLRRNNESTLVNVRKQKHTKTHKKRHNVAGGWYNTPDIREEFRIARLKRVRQKELAKKYAVSVASIRIAAKEFGLLPWLWSTKK